MIGCELTRTPNGANASLMAFITVPGAPVVPALPAPLAPSPVRLSWAKLLKRVFEIDMEHCPNCGGQLKIIAARLERTVIDKMLAHRGLDPQPAQGLRLRW